MKLRVPKDRFSLNIDPNWSVLEIGGGHNPHPRANLIVDKYDNNNNGHRAGDIVVRKGQKFLLADGENLPFEDNEFDYVICCHVLEHVDDPVKFIKEMTRVAKRGYLEMPSLMGEYLVPKGSHEWVFLDIEDTIVGKKKDDVGPIGQHLDFGDFFLYYLSRESIAFKLLMATYPDILTVRYEWEDSLPIVMNPEDEYQNSFFDGALSQEQMLKLFPQRSLKEELSSFFAAFFALSRSMFSKILTGSRLRKLDKTIGLNTQKVS
ncbi:class I SAM-dependent methyltransferase [Flammeovirga sp. MY04]|uniref:class I SAM-dependent methyltransferase n=1 Tax=Flammeovirga sp. MY04 TaxID=1191459 RepID=UPI00080627E9|nr:class I SAM-dependent methyltransferase [Flammeovirga sp. MY04]ANQ52083.1 class I SAM-dependent methyltransferase [Flammeovirga sp. MY04]